MTPDKVTTWPANRPILEASSLQLGICAHCGAYLMTFEAADGSRFALAHVGDSAEALKRWIADSLEAARPLSTEEDHHHRSRPEGGNPPRRITI
jgi:hypothetical protein